MRIQSERPILRPVDDLAPEPSPQGPRPDVVPDVVPGDGPLPTPTVRTIVTLVAVPFALLVLVVVAVDLLGVGSSVADGTYPMWFQLFQEGSAVEWLQMAVLLAVVAWAGVATERARARGHTEALRLLALLGLSAALLLVEDAGNVGERFSTWVGEAVGEDSLAADLARAPVLGVVALVPFYALVRHRRLLATYGRPAALVVFGYLTYAFVGLTGEALNLVVPFYEITGGFLLDDLLGGRLDPGPGASLWGEPGMVFMDYVYEETFELLAGTLLLIGLTGFTRRSGAVSTRTA
jgi:hypothetical protein